MTQISLICVKHDTNIPCTPIFLIQAKKSITDKTNIRSIKHVFAGYPKLCQSVLTSILLNNFPGNTFTSIKCRGDRFH